MSDNEIIPPKNGRADNGRFAKGNVLGVGNRSTRIDVPKLARIKAKELGLDVEVLLWDVVLSMLYKGAMGDVPAAKLSYEMLGMQDAKTSLIAIGLGGNVPEAPPLTQSGSDGAPPFGEHLKRLLAIAEERGLTDIIDLHPADVIDTLAEKQSLDDLLS